MSNPTRRPVSEGGNLVAFDTERAKMAAAKSAEVRRAKKAEKANEVAEASSQRARFQRGDLGTDALMTAHSLIKRVLAGDIPIRNGADAAAIVKALVEIGRLEQGEATALTAHLTGDLSELERSIAKDMAALGISPVAALNQGMEEATAPQKVDTCMDTSGARAERELRPGEPTT